MNIWMIEETRAIAQTLQGVVSVRVSADHACGYFYTRKRTCNSRSNDNTPLLIGGSGMKQYLICLCQSSPLHFATGGVFTNQWQVGGRFFFFLNNVLNFLFSVCDITPPLESVRTPQSWQQLHDCSVIWIFFEVSKLNYFNILRVNSLNKLNPLV